MYKFKVGDVIVYSKALYATVDFCIGDKFEVTEVHDRTHIQIKPIGFYRQGTVGYFTVDQFELADLTLTPEEVLQYFKEGRQHELEYSKYFTSGWSKLHPNEDMYIDQIFKRTWRVKQTIDYYGTAIPKPVTKAEAVAEGLARVYRPQLVGEFKVEDVAVGFMLDYNIYFRTESEASQVVEVLLKPFK